MPITSINSHNIIELFEQNVKSFPDMPALTVSACQKTLSYRELLVEVNKAAIFYQQLGIGKGDGVLVLVPMSFELYITLLALFKLGAVAVFIDPQSSKEHIQKCLNQYPLKGFIGIKKAHLLRLFNREIRSIPLAITPGYLPLTHNFNHYQKVTIKEEIICKVNRKDAALVTFTSGSTGKPKAAVRSHGFLLDQYEILSKNMLFEPGEIDISTLPIFVLANLAAGMHSVIPNVDLLHPARVDGTQLSRDIIQYEATRLGGSPALVSTLLYSIIHQKQSTLKHLYLGGGPVYPGLLARLKMAFPFTKVIGLYGSTEAEPIAHVDSSEYTEIRIEETLNGRGLYTGHPIDDIKIKIIDSDRLNEESSLDELSCAKGEIIVSGSHVLKGYLNGEGDSENKIKREGEIWHRTGDAGYFDSQGGLWLLGRYSQRIHTEKETLYPFAIEAALAERGFQAAIIEHKNTLFLVCEKFTVPKEFISHLPFDRIVVISEIPRDKRHNSKIDYTELKLFLDKLSY